MSALMRITDSSRTSRHVRKVPCVDGSGLAREIFTSQAWSVLPCVRPVGGVHMTAGHNALRGSGPGQKRAFDDAMAAVICEHNLCVTGVVSTPSSGGDAGPTISAKGGMIKPVNI